MYFDQSSTSYAKKLNGYVAETVSSNFPLPLASAPNPPISASVCRTACLSHERALMSLKNGVFFFFLYLFIYLFIYLFVFLFLFLSLFPVFYFFYSSFLLNSIGIIYHQPYF